MERKLTVTVTAQGRMELGGDKFSVGELLQIGQAIIRQAEGVQVEFKKSES